MKKKKILIISLIFILIIGLCIINAIIRNNPLYKVRGIWIADGTQIQYVTGKKNGKIIFNDVSNPFYLTLDGRGNFNLDISTKIISGKYNITESNQVLLVDDSGLLRIICKLKNDELYCNRIATKFVKKP